MGFSNTLKPLKDSVFLFDFIYKRYIDKTDYIKPVYLKVIDKTKKENCRAMLIVKSMQNSHKNVGK